MEWSETKAVGKPPQQKQQQGPHQLKPHTREIISTYFRFRGSALPPSDWKTILPLSGHSSRCHTLLNSLIILDMHQGPRCQICGHDLFPDILSSQHILLIGPCKSFALYFLVESLSSLHALWQLKTSSLCFCPMPCPPLPHSLLTLLQSVCLHNWA